MSTRRSIGQFAVLGAVVALALLLTALSSGSALAAKGGVAAGPKGGGSGSASLSVYQSGVQVSSVSAGSAIDVVGSGFSGNSTVYVGLQGFFGMTAVTADGSGHFTHSTVAPGTAGTYTYVAIVYSHRNWVVAASVAFTVTP